MNAVVQPHAHNAPVQTAHNPDVDMVEAKFRWKKDKLGNQRQTVETKIPVPSMEGLAKILMIPDGPDGKPAKEVELLREAVYGVIRDAIGSYLSDDETRTSFNVADFTWSKIANQPAADRRQSSIDDSVWEGFNADYLSVMPSVTGKTAEQVGNAVLVYGKKFTPVKTNKKVLTSLKEQLALYANNSKKAEDFAEILDLLNRKVDTYLKSDEIELLIANL